MSEISKLRGVRGAISVDEDSKQSILEATGILLSQMAKDNAIDPDDVASILFTMTPDIQSTFPAEAARKLQWNHVPLICAQEVAVPGALAKCIRVLIHWNTTKTASQIKHVYLRKAESLRPDLKQKGV